ncbi:MAG: hypothetical protein O3A55_02105 [Bacteroidetes bacterium]|nr:hypothetical protein [Bacteroidota bacterium]
MPSESEENVKVLLENLWEKITIAGATITALQQENSTINNNLQQCETNLHDVNNSLTALQQENSTINNNLQQCETNLSDVNNSLFLKSTEIKKLRDQLIEANEKISSGVFFSQNERVKFKAEIEDVLDKLNNYIS